MVMPLGTLHIHEIYDSRRHICLTGISVFVLKGQLSTILFNMTVPQLL